MGAAVVPENAPRAHLQRPNRGGEATMVGQTFQAAPPADSCVQSTPSLTLPKQTLSDFSLNHQSVRSHIRLSSPRRLCRQASPSPPHFIDQQNLNPLIRYASWDQSCFPICRQAGMSTRQFFQVRLTQSPPKQAFSASLPHVTDHHHRGRSTCRHPFRTRP